MSNKLTIIAAAFIASAVFATSASALTITNNDTKNHDLRILVTGAKKEEKVKVAAGASAQFDCSKGCKAHLGKKDKGTADLVLKGTETTITIAKDGKLSAM